MVVDMFDITADAMKKKSRDSLTGLFRRTQMTLKYTEEAIRMPILLNDDALHPVATQPMVTLAPTKNVAGQRSVVLLEMHSSTRIQVSGQARDAVRRVGHVAH